MPETVKTGNAHLTSGRLLARNTIWNLSGLVLPMLVGLITIPLIIRGMGVERFGILSLAWVVVGYFGLFDLGLGRALTKMVADKLGSNEERDIVPLAWTSLVLMFLLGIFGAVVTLLVSPLLVHRLLRVPEALQSEALHGFYLLAISIPMVTVTAGLRGVLEALQRFQMVNLIRIPMSLFSFVAPLAVLPFSHSVAAVIGALMIGRLLACVAHLMVCLRAVPGLWYFSVNARLIAPLFKLGGWMTASNLCGPAILYGDRFLISNVLSVGAVTYYTVPFDMISRVLAFPLSVGGVLFPAFAVSMAQEPKRAAMLLERGIKYVFMVVFPVTFLAAVFAPEILQVWLGADFAQQSASVLRWLSVGMLMSCLTHIPFSSLQGIGRSDIAGIVLLLDMPTYFILLFVLAKHFGIPGAAMAWAGRTTVELIVFAALNQRFMPKRVLPLKSTALCLVTTLVLFYSGILLHALAIKVVFVFLTLGAFLFGSWFFFLEQPERVFLTQMRFRGLISALCQRGDALGQ